MINREVKLSRCLFTVMKKYISCVIATLVLSSNSRINLTFPNSCDVIFNFFITSCAKSVLMKACSKLSVSNRADISFLFSNSSVQLISNARSLNKSFDKKDANTNKILSSLFAFMKKNSDFLNRIIQQFLPISST